MSGKATVELPSLSTACRVGFRETETTAVQPVTRCYAEMAWPAGGYFAICRNAADESIAGSPRAIAASYWAATAGSRAHPWAWPRAQLRERIGQRLLQRRRRPFGLPRPVQRPERQPVGRRLIANRPRSARRTPGAIVGRDAGGRGWADEERHGSANHETPISRAMVAEVPLAGLFLRSTISMLSYINWWSKVYV